MLELFIYVLILGSLLFSLLVDYLNVRNIQKDVPLEFQDVYDKEKYKKSQEYLIINTRFDAIEQIITTTILLAFLFFKGFAFLDEFWRIHISSEILRGLVYIGTLSAGAYIIALPFQLYDTFVIEERFGFNKTNSKTFVLDQIKGILLGVILGGAVLSAILWFFEKFEYAWFYAFLFVIGFQMFVMFIAPITIMPLFNKFTPLEAGELKNEIETFARAQNFQLSGIFKMDGSRRSTKANAFFTGFGKLRRIVLFDTLINKQTTEELVAVLAHEIGHYKLKHIFRQLIVSVASTFLTFYIFSVFVNNRFIFDAFYVKDVSIYGSLVFFGIFYSPISTIISLYSLYLSRKYEFEADDYAAKTYKKPLALASALKKLSADSLSNLTPHPLKVFLEYTHPPVLERIDVLKNKQISAK